MFQKVLIANRGEIALRIMRTCAEMGVATVAVYSEADAASLHLREAGESYSIGPAPADKSYLNIDAIINAALKSGAQAIHPGYGFLSENADFAEACAAAGLVFIGPSPQVLRLLGDKAAAKKLAESVGVPVVTGFHGGEENDELLRRKALEIGFPVLIKAVAGGGGRGMRLVYKEAEFQEALQGARREAKASFGDDSLLLEKLLERPRHVEVQIIGDTQGTLLSLGERECSVQRRYQKVVEETPSPAVTDGLRKQMEKAALSLAGAAGYTNAGTVEFLLDTDDSFYFLEVNPRLQVEHPVTEGVTGLDLVRLQLMVADGQPLGLKQKEIIRRGHCIEARIYAEDPANGYIPSSGALQRFLPPSGPWIRNEIGVYQGWEVPIYYDSLLAKLIVYGQDRPQAVVRLKRALDQYLVSGVTTNLELLRAVASDPDFQQGNIDTGFLSRKVEPLLRVEPGLPSEVLISAAACKLARAGLLGRSGQLQDSVAFDPWHATGPWRLGRRGIELRFTYQEQTHSIVASHQAGTGAWEMDTGRETISVELKAPEDGQVEVQGRASGWHVEALSNSEGLLVHWKGRDYLLGEPEVTFVRGAGPHTADSEGSAALKAHMPGVVAQVKVKEGERVTARQTLVVLEAMKMEHLISAPFDATVQRVHCKEGQQVAKGAMLLELERL